jgi:hypothetical protein
MAQNTTADGRTDALKIEMAQHFAENRADYEDADWGEIVYEDDDCVIVADHKGYEFDEWTITADKGDMTSRQFSETMHTLARQKCDHDWSVHYPIVFDKLED